MSIEYEPIPPVPTQTIHVTKAAFPKGNPYLTLRDELGPIFSGLWQTSWLLSKVQKS
jgi:transposase